MTFKEAQDAGFIQALLDGKTLEELASDEFATRKWVGIPESQVMQAIGENVIREIRIKPERKRVPLTAEDLPPMFWIQDKTCTDWLFADRVGSWGIKADLKFYSWEDLKDKEYIWSPDRKTEHPFWKEVGG